MIRIEGKCGISATVLADSISPEGIRLTTFEISYPRLILAELNTHRMLSKNSASSRAIPFEKMAPTLTGRPIRFGQANPGMQDKGEDYDAKVGAFPEMDWEGSEPGNYWELARSYAIDFSKAFYEAGYHKQVYNRLTEPFQMMKTVISGTEWENFFWLRNDGAADPTLHELARCIKEARDKSTPFELQPGHWHSPYVSWAVDQEGAVWWKDENGSHVRTTWEDVLKISAARCAAVSFRNTDYSLEKSLAVFERLVGDERKHASAFEHQATPLLKEVCQRLPISDGYYPDICVNVPQWPQWPQSWEPGVSYMDRNGQLWSGNLRGFVQFRKLIPGENVDG